jgi:hypothetical protein
MINKTEELMKPITAPAIVFPRIMEVEETGAAKIRSKTPRDLSHTMLMVSLMLPNIAVIPTMPGTRKVATSCTTPVAPYLKLNVNIIKIGNKRLQTTWRTDLKDWRRSFSAMYTECMIGVNGLGVFIAFHSEIVFSSNNRP